MQTPMIYGDYLYTCQVSGILSCYEAKTGKKLYEERLGTGHTGYTSSPVASGGNIYFTSEEGDVSVVQACPKFKLIASNSVGEICMATPALSEGVIYYRTQDHLIAIGNKGKPRH